MDPSLTAPAVAEPRRQSLAFPLYRPVATWVLLGAIIVVLIIETVAGGSTDSEVLIRLGAKFTPLIAAGEYWRLFTSMFLHIGIMHLAFNESPERTQVLASIGAEMGIGRIG
jgi:membrane associated rhomboid family serine protease